MSDIPLAPKLVKWAYTGVIRPKLLYACQAWAHKLTTKQIKCKKKLDRLTTTAMVPIKRSTPQATLEIMFNLIPIDLLIEQLGAASFMRTKAHLENTIMLNRPYNVNIVSLTNDIKKYIRHSEYKAYTDGSNIDSKAGAGGIICKLNKIIYRQSKAMQVSFKLS